VYRNAPTTPPPGRCCVCHKTDVGNWLDEERNLCTDCVCTHVLCDSCGADCGLVADFMSMPGFDVATTNVFCGSCLVKGFR
jgi:hypothetical protein